MGETWTRRGERSALSARWNGRESQLAVLDLRFDPAQRLVGCEFEFSSFFVC
jgi:hypothetical protein